MPTARFIHPTYAPRIRAERTIAVGRVVLAQFSLLAIWLDPATPAHNITATYLLLSLYTAAAVALAIVVWWSPSPLRRLHLVTHCTELGLFLVFMYLTEGPTSPFFVYFTFSLVAATLRWGWRGVVWTAAVILVAFNGLGLYTSRVARDPAFELNRFIIRSVYLTVIAVLLGNLGAYERRWRGEVAKLAAWPRTVPQDMTDVVRNVLENAAATLDAPRMLIVWEDQDEPWQRLAVWSGGVLEGHREPPGTYDPVVPAPPGRAPFLCDDLGASTPAVLVASAGGPRPWSGASIHEGLTSRFAIGSVLYVPVQGECVDAHLFALDRTNQTADDLTLGLVVARQAADAMDHFLLSRRVRQAAATEARVRLSRDLHDGVLQSLTGAALKLETVDRLWDRDLRLARDRLEEVRRLVAAEQRDLRALVRELGPSPLGVTPDRIDLRTSLEELVQRLSGVWGLRVRLLLDAPVGDVPSAVAYETYRIVQEALVNVARHAAASEARVTITRRNGELHVVVVDNGRGFPFRGRYDHATLTGLEIGPATLRGRVATLGGSLDIDSSDAGARLDIHLPLAGTEA